MKRVQFSISYPDRLVHPLHERIVETAAVSRGEVLLWSPTADATTLCWFDTDRETAAELVSVVDTLVVRTLVADGDGDGTYAFLRQEAFVFAEEILAAIGEAAVIFVPPVVFRDSGVVEFEAVGESPALRALHDALADLGDLAIEQVQPFERTRAASPLTDRQFAALEAAVAAGYYEVPRRGTVEDVAAALGCAKSTAGELVRKAEATVLRNYVRSR